MTITTMMAIVITIEGTEGADALEKMIAKANVDASIDEALSHGSDRNGGPSCAR